MEDLLSNRSSKLSKASLGTRRRKEGHASKLIEHQITLLTDGGSRNDLKEDSLTQEPGFGVKKDTDSDRSLFLLTLGDLIHVPGLSIHILCTTVPE